MTHRLEMPHRLDVMGDLNKVFCSLPTLYKSKDMVVDRKVFPRGLFQKTYLHSMDSNMRYDAIIDMVS